MQHAFLAGLFGGAACALIGVLVVSMQLSFIGVAIAHAAFAGAILAVVLGVNPLAGAFLFSLAAAAVIGPLAERGDFKPDTSLGIIFSLMMGIAFLLMGLIPGPKVQALSLMWGSILTTTAFDLKILLLTALLVISCIVFFYKELQAIIFNREIATAVGLPAVWFFYGTLFLTGLAIAASLRPIGGLLVFSLILNPAAAAYQLTYSLKRLFALAAIFGVFSCWAGLVFSYWLNLPSGASIVVFSTAIFLVANIFSPKRKVKQVKTLMEVKENAEGIL